MELRTRAIPMDSVLTRPRIRIRLVGIRHIALIRMGRIELKVLGLVIRTRLPDCRLQAQED